MSTGLDWEAIRENNRRRVADEVARGIPHPELDGSAPASRGDRNRYGRKPWRPSTDQPIASPRHDLDEVLRLYRTGLSLRGITEATGADKSTIYRYLDSVGEPRGRKRGPVPG